jgi:tetratricopeptide (TPR) repeat protein
MRKISFSWKPTISGRENWRWGLFMVVASRSGRSARLRIMVRGLLLWLLGLAAAAYLAVTTAWFFILEQRPINYVTWVDCVLAPVRWEEIGQKRGEAFVDEGLQALQARRWSEAVMKIQAGLVRAPYAWKGRRNLGMFFLAAGQRERSLTTLRAGFEGMYPGRDAVELVIQIALMGEDFDFALSLIDQTAEGLSPAIERDRDWLANQKARVLILAKRFEACLAWIEETEILTDVLHESKVLSLIELKRFDEARAALAIWGQGSGVLGGVRRLTVRLEREAGEITAMRAALDKMRDRSPANAGPWIYSVIQESLAGQPEAAAAALDAFLMRFGLKPENIIMAAKPLKDIQAWDLFDRLMAFATDSRINEINLTRLRIEAALERGQLEQARQQLEVYQASRPTEPSAQELIWYEITAALIDELQGGDGAAGAQLASILESNPFDFAFGQKLARLLEEFGRDESALSTWQVVRQRFPGNPKARTAVERISDRLGRTTSSEIVVPEIRDGVALDIDGVLRSVEDSLPDEITMALQSSRLFFQRTTELVAEERWTELDQLLRELRRVRPLWVSAQQASIREVEIELNLGDENWPALVSNIRLQVGGSIDHALDAMKIARRLDARGERSMAESVLAEIEHRHQNFPPAERLRADWAETAAEDAVREDSQPDQRAE